MNKDHELMAERCRQELLRLHRSCSQPENADIQPDIQPDEAHDEPETELEERFPEPDISGLEECDECSEPLSEPEPEFPDLGDSTGYIQVNVRTGGDAFPVEGASVTVTAASDGVRLLMAESVTDMSGASPKIELPAPDAALSQAPDPKSRPYSLYDVTVRAEGFFDARSVDIPVFSGVMSVQDIGMVPVPLYGKSSDETLTVYNQSPDL